ncbi:MAG: hypothetical protein P8176_03795 [Gammaproteobacteria bacterium]
MKINRLLKHTFSFAISTLAVTTISTALSTHAMALSTVEMEYAQDNCTTPPEHDELAKLALEYKSPDQLNEALTQKFGCPLVVDNDFIDSFISKNINKQIITNTGNTRFEGLESCAYHPQREEFACSLSIRQRFGFAGTPAIGSGSNEWVTVCVDFGNGMERVDTASVHVHDEQFGKQPFWYYGVMVQANEKLQALVQNGQTLKARTILSWAVPATHCNYRPVWGNQADFQIKLDP